MDIIVVSEQQVEEWGEVPGTVVHAALAEVASFMASRDRRELAEVLLRKARGDETTVQVLLEEDVPDEVVGFHAQQAAEKALPRSCGRGQLGFAMRIRGPESSQLDRERARDLASTAVGWAARMLAADD